MSQMESLFLCYNLVFNIIGIIWKSWIYVGYIERNYYTSSLTPERNVHNFEQAFKIFSTLKQKQITSVIAVTDLLIIYIL